MRPWFKKKRFIIPLAFLALVLLVNIGNGGTKAVPAAGTSAGSIQPPATEQASDDPTEEVSDEPADDPTEEPTEDPTEEPTKAAPKKVEKPKPKPKSDYDKLSAEQQDAYGEGQDYLESQGFSKQGLIDQLSSDYGSQYKKKDAEKAVDALNEDWYKQAVRVAKEYRETQHFSTQGLIDQLDSDYGSQFTHDQAVYGAKHSR